MHIDWNLLARYISQECTSEERQAVQERIQSDPDFAALLGKLRIATNLRQKESNSIDVDRLWQQLKCAIQLKNAQASYNKTHVASRSRKPQKVFAVLRVAAVVVFSFALTYVFSKGFKQIPWEQKVQDQFKVVTVNNGERINLTLADGSVLTIDAGSEVRYFTSYQSERHVYLQGEACFNVNMDPDHPFYVHANHANVRVVGTRFNVRSWDTESDVIVTVAEGKVTLFREDSLSSESIELSKGEQSTVPIKGPMSKSAHIDAERFFKWMQNEIYLNDSKVKEVVAQLERWYDYQFMFQDPELLDQEISVHIRGANVNEVIRVISVVTNTKVVRNANQIEFLSKM